MPEGAVRADHRDGALSRRALLTPATGALATRAARAGAAPAPLQRSVPSSGERLPAVGLGTWRTFDVGPSPAERAPIRTVLGRFAALGGRVVDSSPMYGAAERVVGDLAAELGLGETLFVATKVWTTGREHRYPAGQATR